MIEEKFSIFTCPVCNESVIYRDGCLYCNVCSEKIPVINGIPFFPGDFKKGNSVSFFNFISSIYETPVWFPVIYKVMSRSLAPIDDRKLLAKLVDFQERNVLDLACGTGRFTRFIAEDSKFILGVDLSKEMLKKAKQYSESEGIKNILFTRMNANKLHIKNNFFDIVSCCWALHLFSDTTKILKEIYRTLKDGGEFIGTTLINKYILSFYSVQKWMKKSMGVTVFEKEKLKNFLSDTGFSDIYMKEKGATIFFKAKK